MNVLGVSTALALSSGGLLARLARADDESRATTLTRAALGAVAVVVVVEEALGLGGLLGARPILLGLAGMCALLGALARRQPDAATQAPRAPGTALEVGLLAALLAALATRAWAALHRTTFLYDTLSYHLHAPATWLADGRLSIVPAVFGDPAPAYAPSNVELLFLFVMAPTRSVAFAQAGQVPLAALACAALAATVREAGGSRAAALAAALVFLFVPEVWQQTTSAMTDVGVAAFFFAALPFLVRLTRRAEGQALLTPLPRVTEVVFFGLAAGLCAGTKVVGAVLVLPLAAVALVACGRAGRRGAGLATALLVAALTTGGFWYLRNLVVAGNPLYPLALKLGGATLWPGVYDAATLRRSAYHLPRGDLAALARLCLEPGIAFAVAGAGALVVGARRRSPWPLLALVVGAELWLAVPYQESRFLFAAWGVVAIAMAVVVAGAPPDAFGIWRWTPIALGVVGSVVENPTAERGAVLGVGALVALVWPRARPLGGRSASRRGLVTAAVVASVLGVGFISPRAPAYAVGDALDDAWAWMRANVRGARVAYTGNNLPVPLAGDALDDDVRYVNVAGAPDDRLHDFARRTPVRDRGPEPAPYREDARYETWLANLRAARRCVLFVAALYPGVQIDADADGFPVERAWADAHPDVFHLRFSSGAARVYDVAP